MRNRKNVIKRFSKKSNRKLGKFKDAMQHVNKITQNKMFKTALSFVPGGSAI